MVLGDTTTTKPQRRGDTENKISSNFMAYQNLNNLHMNLKIDDINNNQKHAVPSEEEIAGANKITAEIIGAAIEVHKALGPGLLESAYEECLCHELGLRGVSFERQVLLPLEYKGIKLDCGYRIDLVVENQIIVELKTVNRIDPIHEAQLLTYMRLRNEWLGLIINFSVPVLKNGIKRIIDDKRAGITTA